MVEKDKKKQEYIRTRFTHARHVFQDMVEMGNAAATTWDGETHKVPKVGWGVLQKRFQILSNS